MCRNRRRATGGGGNRRRRNRLRAQPARRNSKQAGGRTGGGVTGCGVPAVPHRAVFPTGMSHGRGPFGSAPSGTIRLATGSGLSGSTRPAAAGPPVASSCAGPGRHRADPCPRNHLPACRTNPQVPERQAVLLRVRPPGRPRPAVSPSDRGFLRERGSRFLLLPQTRLGRRELGGGSYEVLGCLAHAAGRISFPHHHAVAARVVLKGLPRGDAAAQSGAGRAPVPAEVEPPDIVGVYNFVRHADRRTASGRLTSSWSTVRRPSPLRQILCTGGRPASHGCRCPWRSPTCIEVLPSLGYLHGRVRGLRVLLLPAGQRDQTRGSSSSASTWAGSGDRRRGPARSPGTVGYHRRRSRTPGPRPPPTSTVGRALAVRPLSSTGLPVGLSPTGCPNPHRCRSRSASVPSRAAPCHRSRSGARFALPPEMPSSSPCVCGEVLPWPTSTPAPAFSG